MEQAGNPGAGLSVDPGKWLRVKQKA